MHTFSEGPDPYNYTSGRWLRHDELERKSRFIQFDFDALCRRVVALCPGAQSITSYEKKEGGNNRVFIFHTDNAKCLVARLPFSLAGPPRYTTGSEVATIQYLQTKTSIPIPKILDWSDDASNTIGSEYIIMEHAPGVCLASTWPDMTEIQRAMVMKPIYQKLKEAANLEFPAYGSLYLTNTPHTKDSVIPLDPNFCIGPNCETMYWDCEPTEPRYYHAVNRNQGPWPDQPAYCDGLIDAGISRLPPDAVGPKRPHYHGSIEDHKALLEYCRAVIQKMIQDPSMSMMAQPTLFHPDLNMRNIFVSDEDPTMLTAIIDWQSSGIKPAFWYMHETPDFARKIPDLSDEDKFEPESERRAKAFNLLVRSLLPPAMLAPLEMDEAYFRPFMYGHRTWIHGAAAFRIELIQTARRWKELGFEGECPYPLPSPEECAVHFESFKEFERDYKAKKFLAGMLNVGLDGWVPPEEFEALKRANKELFATIVEDSRGAEGSENVEAEIRDFWLFDLED